MIRTIRVLGAALGALIGLGIAAAGTGLFSGVEYAGFILAAWTIAWTVVGFALLPYLTVVPAARLVDGVQDLSTAEFVAAVLGLFVGLLLGLLLSLPLAQIEGPLGTWLPLGISLFLGLGMMGLTVAKRDDLIAAAEGAGLVRRPGAEPAKLEGEPRIVVDTSVLIDGRIAEIVESGFVYGTLVVPGSCSRSSSTSRTRPTRSAATAAGAGSRSWPACSASRGRPSRSSRTRRPGSRRSTPSSSSSRSGGAGWSSRTTST